MSGLDTSSFLNNTMPRAMETILRFIVSDFSDWKNKPLFVKSAYNQLFCLLHLKRFLNSYKSLHEEGKEVHRLIHIHGSAVSFITLI